MVSKYFWAGITAVLFISLGVFLFLNHYDKKGSELLPIQESAPLNREKAPLTRVKSKEDFIGPTVLYSGDKFFPANLTLTGKPEGSGCLLMILNESQNTLVVRLSPHSVKDDWGFPYLPISPGAQSVIDPRYHMADVAFHNHEKPSEEFSMHLAEPCL